MRRHLIVPALALAACAALLVPFTLRLNASGREVAYQRTDLQGDIAAAEDVAVDVCAQMQELYWESKVHPDGSTDTKSWFNGKPVYGIGDPTYSGGLMIDVGLNQGIGGPDLDPKGETNGEIFEEVASRTKAGESHSEKLRYRDHYEYLPASWWLDWGGKHYHYDSDRDEVVFGPGGPEVHQWMKQLNEQFRFRVDEDLEVTVTVEKDVGGHITNLLIEDETGGTLVQSISLTDAKQVWFIQEQRDESGLRTDLSETPEGYGLYCLPMTEDGEILVDELHLALPLRPTQQVEGFQHSTDYSEMLLQLFENGQRSLLVLDADSGRVKQTILLPVNAEYWTGIVPGEDFLAVFGRSEEEEYITALYIKKDGLYENRFTIEPQTLYEGMSYGSRHITDGDRLVTVATVGVQYPGGERWDRSCGFTLTVIDESGVLYEGLFESSLDRAATQDWNRRIMPGYVGRAELDVQFDTAG